ncbi:MAG: caspase family protein [Thermodesulfobacteriota bacterium]
MKKKALLVGINNYPDPRDALKGCLNDVRRMEETLRGEYGFAGKEDIRVLTDSAATTGAILDGLSWLSAGAKPGDSLVFHYSGHGSQVPDRSGDETTDGMDEILCPYDVDWERPLTDDDLAAACGGIPRGALLTVILDCCHSGTGLRGPSFSCTPARPGAPSRPRYMPCPAGLPRPARRFARRSARRFGVSLTKGNAVLLAACREDQTAADALIRDAYYGAHTFYLCRALRDADWVTTYRFLAASMGVLISKDGFDQVPQLEGPSRLLASRFLEPVPKVRDGRESAMRIGRPLPCR